jgi:hypothetical protein
MEKHNGFYIAPNGVQIMLESNSNGVDEVCVALPVNAGENRKIFIDLVTRFQSVEDFADTAEVKGIHDLHRIKYSVCWSQYIAGSGYISCSVEWLNDATICFRKSKPFLRIGKAGCLLIR